MPKSFNDQKGSPREAGVAHLLVLIAAVGLIGFLLISQTAPFKDKLFSTIFPKPASHAASDYYGRTVKTFGLFGQKDIGSATRQSVTANAAYHGSGVIVDTSSTPNKIYFVDSGNNRILGFNGGDGVAKPADLVIGQPNMNVGNCNGDDNLGFKKAPTAATLCLLAYPVGNNTAEQWGANNIDVDSQGNLYVPDKYNNRVLEYYQPFSTDKTGGKGDSVADFVYGQPDFTSNKPNGGDYNLAIKNPPVLNPPTNNSLSLCCGYGNPTAAGVSVDPFDGGIWVADYYNDRVLHFPQGSRSADVVLGQPNMTTMGCNTDPTNILKMCSPIIARVNPDTHELYVVDIWPQRFPARFMVFKPDSNGHFQTGQAASRIFKPNVAHKTGVNDEMFDSNGYIFKSSGFVFNNDKTDYPNGLIWVNEHERSRTLLLAENGDVVAVINAKDVYHNGRDTAYYGCDHNVYEGDRLSWPNGSIGQDSSNNIYFADEDTGRVIRYSLPYQTYQYNGTTCPPEGNASLLQRGWNIFSNDTLGESIGIVAYGNQLIVSDQNLKYKIWNDYKNKTFGAPADYTLTNDKPRGNFFSGGIDDSGRLWTQHDQRTLEIWQLPITSSNQTPIKNFWQNNAALPIYWADDQSVVSGGGNWGSWAFDPVGKAMYMAQGARILRIKNYNEFNNKLYVDMVIGQTNKTTNNCNQGLSAPNAGTLCEVEQIKFDKLGNLYVVDDTFECHGNRRITVFTADDLKNATGMFPALQAKKVFNAPDFTSPVITVKCAPDITNVPGTPVTIAFNSLNQLVIGNDGYYGDNSQRELKQLWFYANPLSKQTPDASIKLYMGTPADMTFDDSDNLIIRDGTWYRVNMINLCTDPSWLDWLPGVTPVSACSNPTPSPFQVNSVSASVTTTSVLCPKTYNFTGTITTNGAGTVTYNWVRSDGATAPNKTITFTQAGTQAVIDTWTLSALPFNGWEQLKIISPNTLLSNQATFTNTCPKRAFVTSSAYSGKLNEAGSNVGLGTAVNGLDGADKICQASANSKSLGGVWKAWLSNSTTSASSRLTHYSGLYVRLDGQKIANDWTSLTSGTIQNPINVNESNAGGIVDDVWTYTKPDGTGATDTNRHCNNWTAAGTGYYGRLGKTSSTDSNWTLAPTTQQDTCNKLKRLYCIEQ